MAEPETQELVFPELEPGMRFGRYELRREAGRGGMGVVWEAKDHTLGETVALKFLPEILAADKSAMKLIKEEALILLSLTHPNIVRVRNLESQSRRAFIVEEFLSGETLEDLMIARRDEGKGGLTAEEALWALDQIGPGLDYAHTEGVTHRDIKPANMMLDRPVGSSLGGDAAKLKLMDFGLAFVATSTVTMKTGYRPSGTLPYMAPEVLAGAKPTPMADIYSLGTTLYTLIAGECPFAHGDIFNQIQTVTPPPLQSGNDSLDEAITAAMAKDPLDRPVSIDLFCDLAFGEIELEEALQDLPEDEELTDWEPGRGRRTAIAIGVLAVALLAGIAFFVPSIRGALFGDEELVAEGGEFVAETNALAPVPTIHLTSPERDGASTVFTNKDSITIAGRVENAISSEITLLLGPQKQTWVHSDGEFSKAIPLTAGGPLVVSIEAEGADAPTSFEVIYDPVPPEIHLVSPERDFIKVPASKFDFVLDVEEEFIQEVTVDGHPCTEDSPGRFIARGVPLPMEGENVVVIRATDLAGNVRPRSVTVVRDLNGPELVSFTGPGAESEELKVLTGGERVLVTMWFDEPVQALEFGRSQQLVKPPANMVSFDVSVPLQRGPWEIPWSAHDELNNPTSGALTIDIQTNFKLPTDWDVVDQTPGWHGWAREIFDERTQLTFVLIDPGTFLMGSSEWEGEWVGRYGYPSQMDETPRHSRKIERGFYLATTEVTIENWRRFVGEANDPTGPEPTKSFSRDKGGICKPNRDANWEVPIPIHASEYELDDRHPVTQVTWKDARAFCRQYGYRLPKEDEWEYACRAGRTGLYWWGDVAEWGNGNGNFADESLRKTFNNIGPEFPFDDGHVFTAPVGKSGKNPWGLHDMLGNVWEWCEDPYLERAYERDGLVDLVGGNADLRVIRGGSWRSGTEIGRCARRGIAAMDEGSDIVGFRVVMDINE